MNPSTRSVWRLEELVQRSRRLLALLPTGTGESRRVRWQPDARLVRYYTTLGLLDRPAELRGRTAYYRDRHLLQLLAIKTLQARGLRLHTVQASLLGQPDGALTALIGLPSDWVERLAIGQEESQPDRLLVGQESPCAAITPSRFWERAPAPVTSSVGPPLPTPASSSTMVARTESVRELIAVAVAPGAQLLLDRHRYPAIDSRLETALHNLSAVLREADRSSHDHADGGDNDDESGFSDSVR
ncbi:MAG: MerR family transcriptional regulator [Candidatus Competibacteraceae bacterium]|nr:MerR family transcriptional regulator [Candidatus Competibacteraceae bacterium]